MQKYEIEKQCMRDYLEVLRKQQPDIVSQGTRCGFQIYFPRKKNNFHVLIKKVPFSSKRSGTLNILPFENVMV